jgi:proteasome lid subunit RPN8/RPN11
MKRILRISYKNLENLAYMAKRFLPNECCALLAGLLDHTSTSNETTVINVIPVNNADQSATRFRMDEGELMNSYQIVESKGMQMVGIFHSHHSVPVPSFTDRRFMEINPVIWLIYSTTTDEFKAYALEKDLEYVAIEPF